MSDAQTLTLIQAYIDAFNKGDREAMLACLSEDVAHDINEGGREIGKEKFRWFLGMMDRHYREQLEDVVIMVGQGGGRAAAEFTVHGTYLSSVEGLPPANGQSYSVPGGIFFDIDEGRISRVTTYYNLADWTAKVASKA